MMSTPLAFKAASRPVLTEVGPSPVPAPSLDAERLAEIGRRALEHVGDSPVRCAACGGPCHNVAPLVHWALFGGDWTLVECEQCQTVRTHPLPDPEVIRQVYANFNYDWYRHHYPAKLADSLLRLLEYRARGLLEGERLLDFGGGVGYFSKAARLLGYTAHTYDPMLGNGHAPAEGSCDSIFAHHVIEHASDPDELVRRMVGFLKPGGRAVLAVPNGLGEGYLSRGNAWTWSQPPLIHLHHFSERGLVELLTRHGLAVQEVSFHERWDANLVSDLRLGGLFERMDRRYASARRKRWVALSNSALRFAALAASQVYARTQPASALSELLVVARKER